MDPLHDNSDVRFGIDSDDGETGTDDDTNCGVGWDNDKRNLLK